MWRSPAAATAWRCSPGFITLPASSAPMRRLKYYDVMDPFVVLGAAAAVTKTLLLGTGICLIAQRDPIQTAKQVASIDQVSGGRFLFGVGNGWNEDEMAKHGTAFASRHKLVARACRGHEAGLY